MSDGANDAGHHPPAGWYPDPARSGRLRYWDGAAWTQYLSDPTQPGPGGWQPPPRRSSRFAVWQILLMVAGGVFALLLLLFGICVAMFAGY